MAFAYATVLTAKAQATAAAGVNIKLGEWLNVIKGMPRF